MSRYPFTGPNYAQHGEVAGYIYYPWNDQYYIDPQMVQSYNESVGLAEPTPKEPSYMDTLMPVAGSAAALAVGTGVGNKIMTGDWPSWIGGASTTPAVTQVAPQAAGQIAMGGGTTAGAVAAGGELGGGAIEAGRQAYLGSIPSGAEVGTFDAGGPIGSNIGTVAQGALGAAGLGLGLHGMYGAHEEGNPLGGAISGAGAGAGGLALAGSLGLATGGLALPVILGAAALGGGAGFLGDRKTTQEYQQERWGDLQERGVVGADQAWALKQQQNQGDGVWQDGKYAGQSWTFEKALDTVKDNPDGFLLEAGNFDTFGSDWLTAYDHEQRRAIVSQLAHNDLYKSEKGSVLVKDKEKAREIADRVKAGQLGVQASGMPQSATNQGAPPPPATTGTSRPKPLQEQDLVQEGQKQMEKGNMIPAGQGMGVNMMHPEQLVQPTVQPQGMIPQPKLTPEMIEQMGRQNIEQKYGWTGNMQKDRHNFATAQWQPPQASPMYNQQGQYVPWSPQATQHQQQLIGQGIGNQQAQQPVGMIPAQVQPAPQQPAPPMQQPQQQQPTGMIPRWAQNNPLAWQMYQHGQ